RARPWSVFKQHAKYAFNHQIRAMKQPPHDEGPGSAMPKPTEEHHDNKIERSTERSNLIATERNVKVIAKKSGKRNMPPPPKIRKADRCVGEAKIVLEMETQG